MENVSFVMMTINAQNVKKRKRNFSMGRVKDMCMENEEKFYDLVGDLVGSQVDRVDTPINAMPFCD